MTISFSRSAKISAYQNHSRRQLKRDPSPRPQEKERIQVTVEEETGAVNQTIIGRESGLFCESSERFTKGDQRRPPESRERQANKILLIRLIMSDVPIVRQVSWIGAVPQLIALVLAVFIGKFLFPDYGFLFGASVYLVYSFGSRLLIVRDHRSGIDLVKKGEYAAAIPRFEESLRFLDRHPWIDNARSIVLMSASKSSFREMALANIGFCYSQLGRGAEAKAAYEKCLARFPDSGLATAALRMLNSPGTQ